MGLWPKLVKWRRIPGLCSKSHIVMRANIAYHKVYGKISKGKIWKTLVGTFLLKYKAMNTWGNNAGLANQTGKNDLSGCLFPLCVCLCPLALLTAESTGPLTYRCSPHLSQRSQASLSWSRKYLKGLRSSLLWQGVWGWSEAQCSLIAFGLPSGLNQIEPELTQNPWNVPRLPSSFPLETLVSLP